MVHWIGERSTWIVVLVTAAILAGCGSAGDAPPVDALPAEVQTAPVAVREAYQFAVENPAVLTAIPCYCGCGAMGHTSNYACYVADVDESGHVSYDLHALGCSICVDITRDAMRLLGQGTDLAAIRTYVDQTYSPYGPSNMP